MIVANITGNWKNTGVIGNGKTGTWVTETWITNR